MAELARYFQNNPRRAVLTPLSVANTGGEMIGQAISQVGAQIDQIAEREEMFWVQKQMADIDRFSRETWESAVNSATDGAEGFEANYLGALDSRYDQIRQQAPSGRARRAFEAEVLRHRTAQSAAAQGFATQEKYEFRKHTILGEADNLATDLFRQPGVAPWQPQGALQNAVGLPAPFQAEPGFFSTGVEDPTAGIFVPGNIEAWSSKYYSPRDFADGAHMGDRSGAVLIGKQQLAAIDWVTDEFGYGKLQINSGYRSSASNQKRASSGPQGPHTQGKSIDVQVRHLPQAEKDRLYSLFRAAGANAFGFGEGVLHVEWREGQGDGRNNDFEWTYGGAQKYNLIPVVSPNSRASVASEIPASNSGDTSNLRPFQSWEYRANPDGTKSTEISTTFQAADGSWVNAPSLWRNNDGWVQLDEEQQVLAVEEYEQRTGEKFPRFATLEEAEAAAQERSNQGGSAAGANAYNQYPYLTAVALTARNETGTGDLAQASLQIATEADGTISAGALGLNSSGLLPAFLKEHGAAVGITASPGSPEFAAQWETAVRSDPEGFVGRQLQFHESHVVKPAQASMQAMGASSVVNDPRAVAFTSDLIVQYGPELARKHIAAGRGAKDVAAYVDAVTASTKASLDSDFRTAISNDPSVRRGLENRIDRRATGAMQASPGGAIATGNVPRWDGPIPALEDNAEAMIKLDRIEKMVDTMGGTPAQRREIKDQLRGQVVGAWLTSVSQTNPSAAMAILMSGRYDKDLSLGDVTSLMSGSQATYAKYESDIRARQKELMDGLKAEASQVFADEIASISATGKGTGRLSEAHLAVASEKEKADLEFAQFAYRTSQEISSASTSDLPAILEALRPEGEGFAEEQRRYQFAQEMIAKRMEMQANDPAALALQQSPDLMQKWRTAIGNSDSVGINSAIQAMRAAQERMGVPADKIRSMPQQAITSFEELLTKAEDADQAFAGIQQLRDLFGPEAGTIMAEMEASGLAQGWRQVSDLMDSGHTLAAKSLTRVVHAGEYGDDAALGVRLAMDGRADVARKIFDGRLRRKEIPGLMPTGKDEDLDLNVKQIIGGYVGDAFGMDGKQFNVVREAALSFYAADLPFGASVDGAKLEDAIDQVTGGILEWNSDGESGKFVAPVPGMTQQQFYDDAWRLDDEALKGAFVGYAYEDEPLTRDDLASIQFVSAGQGQYFLNWPGAGLARTADGQPFVLDFRKQVMLSRDRALAKTLEGQVGASMTSGEPPLGSDGPMLDELRDQVMTPPMSAW